MAVAGPVEDQEPLQLLLHGLRAVGRGEPPPQLPEHWSGLFGEVAQAFNGLVTRSSATPDAHPNGANGKTQRTVRARDPWEGKAALLLEALQAVRRGDGSAKLPITWPGLSGKIAEAFNDVVDLNVRTQTELARLSRVVGKEGKLKQRANLGDVSGF
jgi:hypothetical protein